MASSNKKAGMGRIFIDLIEGGNSAHKEQELADDTNMTASHDTCMRAARRPIPAAAATAACVFYIVPPLLSAGLLASHVYSPCFPSFCFLFGLNRVMAQVHFPEFFLSFHACFAYGGAVGYLKLSWQPARWFILFSSFFFPSPLLFSSRIFSFNSLFFFPPTCL